MKKSNNNSGWNIGKSMVIALLLTSNNYIQDTNATNLEIFKYNRNNMYTLN